MGMSQSYGPGDELESLATIDQALDAGVTLFDTADVYGDGANEELLGHALAGRRDDAVIATKFGLARIAGGVAVNGRPDYVRSCCEASLRRLNTDRIDVYFQHRVDPDVPIEETVGAMAQLVQAGKVQYLGLSEASARTINRAVAVHPIAALQSEWSLLSRDLESDVLPVARANGIGIVAYSPLGRGFLTGTIEDVNQLDAGDVRRRQPRFQGENLRTNLELVSRCKAVAVRKGCTVGQVALAWVMAQGADVVPIAGTKRRTYLMENLAAGSVTLDADDFEQLNSIGRPGTVAGARHTSPEYGESADLVGGDDAITPNGEQS
jgi:aryl-alcohol dehydrogenase-like predicted oxidoreductase